MVHWYFCQWLRYAGDTSVYYLALMKEHSSADFRLPSRCIVMSSGSASDGITATRSKYAVIMLFSYSFTDPVTLALQSNASMSRMTPSPPFTDGATNAQGSALRYQQAGLRLSPTKPGADASPQVSTMMALVTERLRGEEYTSFRKQLAHNSRESKIRSKEEDNSVQRTRQFIVIGVPLCSPESNSERCLFSFS